MKSRDAFSGCHPVINFLFFAGALVGGMLFLHPAFLLCSLLFSGVYYMTIRKREAARFLLGMLPLFLLLSVMNPLFNTGGMTVLFSIFGRPYTLEALFYGMAMAALFVSVFVWFACYNAVMTSDKFLYLFGRMIPSISLVLTMVLRLVPNYQKKITQVGGARRCIGMSADTGTSREKAEHGLIIVSALTSWALEGGIIMADSMRSRGYGCGKRTNFSLYRFENRDRLLVVLMLVLLAAVAACWIGGGAAVGFIPELEVPGMENLYTVIGVVAYALFLAIPTAVNLTEEIIWHILKSGI